MSDWSAAQYLKFQDERTRAARDLLARVPPGPRRVIFDLGCGPGNSTALLAERYPDAAIIGVDSSPDMLREARRQLPACRFVQADLATWSPDRRTAGDGGTLAGAHRDPAIDSRIDTAAGSGASAGKAPADLLFANAVFQWIPTRDECFARLLGVMAEGGVLAVQMPDNDAEPSHELLRDVAAAGSWAETLAPVRTARDRLPSPAEYYDRLAPLCRRVDIWHVVYNHVLPTPAAIVEWVKGTRLRPYLAALDASQHEPFLAAYTARLADAYPPRIDGAVLLRFPRLFFVAER